MKMEQIKNRLKGIIKEFVMFPSGSYAYSMVREIQSEEDVEQLLSELEHNYCKCKSQLTKKQ